MHCQKKIESATMNNSYLEECNMNTGMPPGSWRDSARPSKFFIFNSTTTFPVLFFLFNISWNSFFIMCGVMASFMVLEYYGFTPRVFGRFLRSVVAGKRRIASPGGFSMQLEQLTKIFT